MYGSFVAKTFNVTRLNSLHPLGGNVAQWNYAVSYITKLCVIKVNGIWNKGIIALVFIASLKSTNVRLYIGVTWSLTHKFQYLRLVGLQSVQFPPQKQTFLSVFSGFVVHVSVTTFLTQWLIYLPPDGVCVVLIKTTVINLCSIQ